MKKVLVFISMLLLISGCSSKEKTLESVIAENNYVILDVRTNIEYERGHVVDAINIPVDSINESVKLDKGKTIIVYCQSGTRSNIAREKLESLGYDVLDLGAYDTIDLKKE